MCVNDDIQKMQLLKILDAGLYPGLSRDAKLSVRVVNGLAIIGVLAVLAAIFVSMKQKDPWHLYLMPMIGFTASFMLNYSRKYYIAALIEIIVAAGTALIFAYATENATWHLCMIPTLVFPFFVFSVEYKSTAIVSAILVYFVYAGMQVDAHPQVVPWIELMVGLGMVVFAFLSKRSMEQVELALLEERAMSNRLLHNFLPEKIAKILRESGGKPPMIAQRYDNVCVIFSDIVNFTQMSEKLTPEQLVTVLNQLFTEFDKLIELHGLEKIKTIGDAYMVAGGVPEEMPNAPGAAADFALDMLDVVKRLDKKWQHGLDMRIGMHIGPVVAGVIGRNKFAFDMWGDTVNVAARMESHGVPGEIHISENMAERLEDNYLIAQRGWVEVKGKGLLQTFWLKSRENVDMSDEDTLVLEKASASDMSTTITTSQPTVTQEQPQREPRKQSSRAQKKPATWASNALKKQNRKAKPPERRGTDSTGSKKQKKTFWEK